MNIWPHPCIDSYKMCAEQSPETLLLWIQSGELGVGELTHALEYLGKVKISVLECLYKALENKESPLIREGAVYGLEQIYRTIKDKLGNLLCEDTSTGVRRAAKDALDL